MKRSQGFTLIELIVTLAILAFLLLGAAPLATDWVSSARTRDGRSKLVQAYGQAKALALRNPARTAAPAPAAGLRVVTSGTTSTLLVCQGDPTATACSAGGSAQQWTADLPAGTSLSIAGTTATSSAVLTVGIDNRGLALAATDFRVRRGGSNNDETGTLY